MLTLGYIMLVQWVALKKAVFSQNQDAIVAVCRVLWQMLIFPAQNFIVDNIN